MTNDSENYRIYHVPTNVTIAYTPHEHWAKIISEAYFLAYEEVTDND